MEEIRTEFKSIHGTDIQILKDFLKDDPLCEKYWVFFKKPDWEIHLDTVCDIVASMNVAHKLKNKLKTDRLAIEDWKMVTGFIVETTKDVNLKWNFYLYHMHVKNIQETRWLQDICERSLLNMVKTLGRNCSKKFRAPFNNLAEDKTRKLVAKLRKIREGKPEEKEKDDDTRPGMGPNFTICH